MRYSIVIPVYNEEENLPILYERLREVTADMDGECEIVLVNDGSVDRSWQIIEDLHRKDQRVKGVALSRNFGQQTAISAGVEQASGEAVIIMDADLQDDPETLSKFAEAWRQGYEVVYAVRKERKEGVLKRTAYFIFYRMLRAISDLDIPLDSGDFCLMDRKVVDLLKQMPEARRFIRGLRAWGGFRQLAVECERGARLAGDPKFSLTKLTGLALDGLLSFSLFPLRLATYLGVMASLLAFSGIAIVLYIRLLTDRAYPAWASTVIPVLFLGGVQLLTIGIVGEYVGRIYDEVKRRPTYVIATRIGFEETPVARAPVASR